MAGWIPAAIGAVGQIAGSAISGMNSSAASSGWVPPSPHNARYQRNLQLRLQTHSTRNTIRDAIRYGNKYGIHPLTALGINPASGNSVAAAFQGSTGYKPGTDYGLSAAGQGIKEALSNHESPEEKAVRTEILKLQLEREHLTNDGLLMENLQRQKELTNSAGKAPGVPSSMTQIIPGQGTNVTVKPDEVIDHQNGHTTGVHAFKQFRTGEEKELYSTIQQDAGDALDADFPSKVRYNMREGIKMLKSWAGWKPSKKPPIKPDPGYIWHWSRAYGQWVQKKAGSIKSGKHQRRYNGHEVYRGKIYK